MKDMLTIVQIAALSIGSFGLGLSMIDSRVSKESRIVTQACMPVLNQCMEVLNTCAEGLQKERGR